MSILTSTTTTTATAAPQGAAWSQVQTPERYRKVSFDEDLSVASSKDLLCASPSSAYRNGPVKKILQEPATASILKSGKEDNYLQESQQQQQQLPLLKAAKGALKLFYGNADFSDCIGRTLTILLLTRLTVSIVMVKFLDEEYAEL